MRNINAQTALYGVLGNPVRHSLSPLIHNALFEQFNMNSVYMAFEVEPNSLGLAFEALRSLGIRGVNLTVPFKEEALHHIDEVPEDVDRAVGAINTVVNRDGRLFGYNTDGAGFLTALKEDLSFKPAGKNILVLGAGGAARGVVFSLARAEADRIVMFNRTRSRAEGLKEYAAGHFLDVEFDVIDEGELAELKPDLVINATAAGMNDAEMAVDLGSLGGKPTVYDLVYAPAQTPLLKEAARLGLPHANGLGMLAAQAALSFELWTGKKEGVREKMLEVLKK